MLSWFALYPWYLWFAKERQTKIHRVLHKSLTLSYEILFDIAKPLKIAIPGKKGIEEQ